ADRSCRCCYRHSTSSKARHTTGLRNTFPKEYIAPSRAIFALNRAISAIPFSIPFSHDQQVTSMRFALRACVAVSLLSAVGIANAQITASNQTAASKEARAGEAQFRDLYKELIEINTTLSAGSCTDA